MREVPATQGANYTKYTMLQGEELHFRIAFGVQAPSNQFFISIPQMQMDIGTYAGATNFNTTNMVVQLRAQGTVIRNTPCSGQSVRGTLAVM